MRRLFLILAVVLSISACASSYPIATAQLSAEEQIYHIQSGDVLFVRVFKENELTGRYGVDSQGQIALPLLGKVALHDMPEAQAAVTIEQALRQKGYLKNAKVSVEVAESRPFFVLGEVEKRGEYPFKSRLTVYQAVAIAGGYTYRADRGDITIRRTRRGVAQTYRADEQTPVLPGDVIEVRERYF